MPDSPSSHLACDRARQYASLDLDDELSELESALLAAHLRKCPPCAAAVEAMRAFTAALRAAPPERLERRLFFPGRRSRAGHLAVRLAAAAVLATLAAGLGFFVGSVGDDRSRPAPPTSSEIAFLPRNDEFRQLRGARERLEGRNKEFTLPPGGRANGV